MSKTMTYEEFRRQAAGCWQVPVYRRVIADQVTPVSLYDRVYPSSPSFLLESRDDLKIGRYSFIGYEPFFIVESRGEDLFLHLPGGGDQQTERMPLEALGDLLEITRSPRSQAAIPFWGGLAGYFGYDVVRTIEKLPDAPPDTLGLPDLYFVSPAKMLVCDHFTSELFLVRMVFTHEDPAGAIAGAFSAKGTAPRKAPEAELRRRYEEAVGQLKAMQDRFLHERSEPRSFAAAGGCGKPRASVSREEYMRLVDRAKEHIRRGDIFQVVLSQRLDVECSRDPFEVYRVLRSLNPSPYMFFFHLPGFQLAGSSPEMLVKVREGMVSTSPIAGTRPRGQSPEEDRALAEDLLSDEKERAEHVMLVDLGRNDLGKVCRPGTVEVTEFMKAENFSHVIHITSKVRGQLEEGRSPLDAVAACLPAGTLSGAPKVRAMEIIDSFEPVKRGPYGGAAGYLSATGDLDLCITIRTIVVKEGRAYVQAGAGIVSDSDPAREYQETVNKAAAQLKALEEAVE